jgi:hypothetical protein
MLQNGSLNYKFAGIYKVYIPGIYLILGGKTWRIYPCHIPGIYKIEVKSYTFDIPGI